MIRAGAGFLNINRPEQLDSAGRIRNLIPYPDALRIVLEQHPAPARRNRRR